MEHKFNKKNKLSYEYVKKYIEDSGDTLISTEYIHSQEDLELKCKYCKEIYNAPFVRYQQGRRHTYCKNRHLRSDEYNEKRVPRTEQPGYPTRIINCSACSKPFTQKYSKQKVCDIKCRNLLIQNRRGTGHYEKIGRMGGIISAAVQTRRSINEINFAELCEKKFKNVLTNKPIFDGWDADIILTDLKIAISWNGIWHYKKVRENHNLAQVQSRDKIKDNIIKNCGYRHYIIQDMGSKSKKFVQTQFDIFSDYVYSLPNINELVEFINISGEFDKLKNEILDKITNDDLNREEIKSLEIKAEEVPTTNEVKVETPKISSKNNRYKSEVFTDEFGLKYTKYTKYNQELTILPPLPKITTDSNNNIYKGIPSPIL